MAVYENLIATHIDRSIEVKKALQEQVDVINRAGLLAAAALEKGGKILLCGNGGSAADAQHIAAELVVRYKGGNERSALPALSLSPDPSTITACANDYGYDQLFARGVEAFGSTGDVLVGLSTSGNSENIINAVARARKRGLAVMLLLGKDGGELKGQGDVEIIVPSDETARIQEAHILIGHILCAIIEKKMFNLD